MNLLCLHIVTSPNKAVANNYNTSEFCQRLVHVSELRSQVSIEEDIYLTGTPVLCTSTLLCHGDCIMSTIITVTLSVQPLLTASTAILLQASS